MNKNISHFIQLGLAIVIMSTSGTLGRMIELPPPVTIWLRCVIGALALFIFIKIKGINLKIWKGNFWLLFISSIFLGLHWVTYFFSLQMTSVAIGMLSLFTYPVITALLEPLMLRTRLMPGSLVLGLFAFFGVALLVPELSFQNEHTIGIAVGVVSALVYSIRNILLKKKVGEHSGIAIMYYQLIIIALFLLPVLFIYDFSWSADVLPRWQPILILALFTTATGHTLFVLSFRYFTISTVSIISAITPLLGSTLGYLVLAEVPAGKTFLGGVLIFITVVAESIRSAKQKLG